MKRGTTPTLPIEIEADISNLKLIEFVFKREPCPDLPAIVEKRYDSSNWIIQDGATPESFTIEVRFTAEETMKFPSGIVYMDTRLVLLNDDISATTIAPIDVANTLFSEVYRE